MSSKPVDDAIVEMNVDLLRSRSEVGMRKYGTSLERADQPTDVWIQHAIEETADNLNYLQKLKRHWIPTFEEKSLLISALDYFVYHSAFPSDRIAAEKLIKKIKASE